MIVDTDALVALSGESHPNHSKAKAALDAGPITVTLGTLVEFTVVLRREAKDRGLDGNGIAREGLARLRGHPSYRPASPVPEEEIASIYQTNPRLSFVDAWNVAASRRTREPLVTFDRDAQRAAKGPHVK